MNLFGSIAVVLYLLLVPETPCWLLNNGQREEAVHSLNYIAKFNGSSKRIPVNAEFDVVSQAIRQNKTLEMTSVGILHAHESKSIMSIASRVQFEKTSNGTKITGPVFN